MNNNIEKISFGKTSNDCSVYKYVLKNKNGMEVHVTNYGATITNIIVPVSGSEKRDVVLGFDNVSGYENTGLYLGASIGRYAGQIKNSYFEMNNRKYDVFKNDHDNCMHGGNEGFDKKVFSAQCIENKVIFRYISPDMEGGFPGTLDFEVEYELGDDNALRIKHTAISDMDTVLSTTNHSYFNLDGHKSGTIENHMLQINADEFLELSTDCCPNGKILSVEGTPMDFRTKKRVGEEIALPYDQLLISEGYDHNWNIKGKYGEMKHMATLYSSKEDVKLSVESDFPGLQMYSGNYISGNETGKEGYIYQKRNGLCLEAQFYPASPAYDNFPSTVLCANKRYEHTINFRFEW